MTPARGREMIDFVRGSFRVSIRRACRAVPAARATYHYRSRRPEQAPLRKRIREIAETRMRYGYRRVHVLLRREGWQVNIKRVRRLYKLESYITLRHLNNMANVMLATGLMVAYGYLMEAFMSWFSGDIYEESMMVKRAFTARPMDPPVPKKMRQGSAAAENAAFPWPISHHKEFKKVMSWFFCVSLRLR